MNYEKPTDKDWKFVAYYTDKYTLEAENLKKSLDMFDVGYSIMGVPDQGNWQNNTLFKSTFVKRMLKQKIVYIDADARLKRYPSLFDTLDYDFAYWQCEQNGQKFLASGTLFFTPSSITLVELWESLCMDEKLSEGEANDQQLLGKALGMIKLNTKILPIEYCQIFDWHFQSDEPVIVHNQASRRYKC